MKFAEAKPAPKPRSKLAVKIAWIYAALLTVMALGQLFAFEEFIPLIREYNLPGAWGTASLVAGLIVVTEVFALPFLLRMRLSPLMRWFGFICSVAAAAAWVKLSVYALLADTALENSGILGTKIATPTGFITLVISLTLLVLAVWSAYGLWPQVRKKTK